MMGVVNMEAEDHLDISSLHFIYDHVKLTINPIQTRSHKITNDESSKSIIEDVKFFLEGFHPKPTRFDKPLP